MKRADLESILYGFPNEISSRINAAPLASGAVLLLLGFFFGLFPRLLIALPLLGEWNLGHQNITAESKNPAGQDASANAEKDLSGRNGPTPLDL